MLAPKGHMAEFAGHMDPARDMGRVRLEETGPGIDLEGGLDVSMAKEGLDKRVAG